MEVQVDGRGKRLAIGIGAGLAGVLAWRALAKRAEGAAGYPPFDVPKPFAEDVWIVDAEPIGVGGLALPIRMSVIRLPNGDLLLHSPTRHTPELGRALDALGRVRHLVAPNGAHWMFVADWQRAYPDAVSWGAPGVSARGAVRRSGVRFDRMLGDEAPAAWDETIEQGVVPGGLGFREVWLFHRPSRTLVLTDIVQNLEPARLTPGTGLAMRAARATDGRAAVHVRAVFRAGGEAARAAAARIVALRPDRVVFAHGAPFTEDAPAALARALDWLAPSP